MTDSAVTSADSSAAEAPSSAGVSHVRLEVSAGIATLHVNRPPMNALNAQTQRELHQLAGELGRRRDVAAVVIYGGERVFAAGADVKEMATMSYTDMVHHSADLEAALTAVARIPQPVVAAITGYALGAGCELALCADRRIAADNAKLGLPEVALGVIPGAGGTQRLPRLIGVARAKDLIYSGRYVGAAEALQLGLVDEVVEPAQVYAAAQAYAARFVGGPVYAVRAAKAAIDRGLETNLDAGLEIERQQFAALFATQDRTRGMTSFVEDGPGKATFIGG